MAITMSLKTSRVAAGSRSLVVQRWRGMVTASTLRASRVAAAVDAELCLVAPQLARELVSNALATEAVAAGLRSSGAQLPTASLPDLSLLATTAQDTRDRAAPLLAATTPPRPSADPCHVMQLHAESERAVLGHAREVLSGRAWTGEAGESAGDSNKAEGELSFHPCGHPASPSVKPLGSSPLHAADTSPAEGPSRASATAT